MAEALVAVGSIAAILQLADYSKRFLKFLKEYQEKSKNLPLSFQIILSQHHLLIRNLEILEARVQQNQIDNASIPDVQTLFDACRKEVDWLENVLNRITASGTKSRARSFIKAASATRYEKNIQQSAATFKECFAALLLNYQTTYMPLPQALPTVGNVDSDKAQSLVAVTGSPQIIRELQTSLIATNGNEQQVQQQTTLMAEQSLVVAVGPSNDIQGVQTSLIVTGREEQHVLQRCNCRRREVVESAQSWNLGSVSVSSEVLTRHRRGCPFHERCIKHNRLSFGLKYTSVMLRIIARVTMSMQYGAGGISLSPHLTLRGMRRQSSPAFRLFNKRDWKNWHTLADGIARINQISLRLQQLVDDRLISPYDLDENGSSLVSVAYHRFSLFVQPWSLYYPSILGLFKLFGNLGVPFDDIGNRCVLKINSRLPILQYLEEMGADFDPEILTFLMKWSPDTGADGSLEFNRAQPCQALLCEKMFPDYAELLDCTSLHFGVLQRRVSQVEDIIKADPSAIHLRNAFGQSALHVAADWPWATTLLLTRGADPYQVDTYGCTAIDYACRLNSYEVVRILLEADSPLPDATALQSVMVCCASKESRELLKLMISHLATRRGQLLQTARILLPAATLNSIVPVNETVPDSSSHQLIEAVRATGHPKNPGYWFQYPLGLYHFSNLSPAAADVLYEGNFRYLEGRKYGGGTLLTYTFTSAMTVWLYRKGASFTAWHTPHIHPTYGQSSPRPSMYGALLNVLFLIGFYTKEQRFRIRTFREEDIEALNIFLQDEFSGCQDLCRCPCCSGGCSPEVMLLKTVLATPIPMIYRTLPMNPLPKLVLSVDAVLTGLHGRLIESSFTRLCHAAIRMALFVDLGLRHLCCEIVYGYQTSTRVSEEEAEEIREEDKFLLERFEALLPKALSEWAKSPKNFAGFWREFHRANICRQRNIYLDESGMDRLRELGVTVHQGEQEKDCGFLYGDGKGYCESL